jgi:hypothetical protein
MNPPTDSHEPTAEFLAHLEWQIESALRRESRLASPVSTGRAPLRAAFIVAVAVMAGGIAGVASGRVQDARQRDQLLETARSEENFARVRLDLVRATYDETRRRFEVGTVDRETLLGVEREMRAMEASLARIHLDLEEIQVTSAAPRNDLDAPLVGRRDFVRERLTLEMGSAQNAMTMAEQNVAQAEGRVKVGVAPRAAQLQAEAELAQARSHLQLLRATLELRERYLKGEIKRDALMPTMRRTELTFQLDRAQREIEIARQRVEEVRRMFAVGQAMELDLKRAEVDVLERQVEIQRVQRELEMLGAVKR